MGVEMPWFEVECVLCQVPNSEISFTQKNSWLYHCARLCNGPCDGMLPACLLLVLLQHSFNFLSQNLSMIDLRVQGLIKNWTQPESAQHEDGWCSWCFEETTQALWCTLPLRKLFEVCQTPMCRILCADVRACACVQAPCVCGSRASHPAQHSALQHQHQVQAVQVQAKTHAT